jgi:hypothetical protein
MSLVIWSKWKDNYLIPILNTKTQMQGLLSLVVIVCSITSIFNSSHNSTWTKSFMSVFDNFVLRTDHKINIKIQKLVIKVIMWCTSDSNDLILCDISSHCTINLRYLSLSFSMYRILHPQPLYMYTGVSLQCVRGPLVHTGRRR